MFVVAGGGFVTACNVLQSDARGGEREVHVVGEKDGHFEEVKRLQWWRVWFWVSPRWLFGGAMNGGFKGWE